MVNEYKQLCPVLFGKDAIKEIGNKALEFGATKVLCVYDQGVKNCGIADCVTGYLKDAGLAADLFEDVVPDAPDNVINEEGERIYGKGYDLIIGIGGGSSMDTAKALSVLAEHKPPISDYYAEIVGMNLSDKVKLILVPTASGTGSEMTPISVIFDTQKQVKATVLKCSDLAIVDPLLTVTAPPQVTSASGLDAFSHALEAYTSATPNPKSDLLALEAMKLIYENLEIACKDGNDLKARTALSFASNIAGMAFADASVHIGHCAAHELGAKFHIPHGVVCAISVPATVDFTVQVVGDKIYGLADILGINTNGKEDPSELGKKISDRLRDFCRRCGISSLKKMKLKRDAVIDCAQGAIDNNWFVIRTPRPVGLEEMQEYIADMYDNY